MWEHARLLRAVLLTASVLTLTGVHVPHQRTPDGWRFARLVPLTLSGFAIAGNIGHIATVTDNAYKLMYALTLNASNVHGVLMLVFLLFYRRRVHALLRQVAELERATVGCQLNGNFYQIQSRAVALIAIPVVSFSCWLIGFASMSEAKYPNYIIEWFIPTAFRGPHWYGVITAVQMMSGFVSNTCQMGFDVLLAGLAEGMTTFQERFVAYCEKHLALDCNDSKEVKPAILSGAPPGKLIKSKDEDDEEIGEHFRQLRTNRVAVWNVSAPISHTVPGAAGRQPLDRLGETDGSEAPPDLEWHLRQLASTYAAVRRLAADSASVCSMSILSLHATATGGLLLGTYVTMLMLFSKDVSTAPHLVGFLTFTLGMVLRVLVLSCSGSRLIESGERLHQTLAGLRWPAAASPAARFQLQLLLEQTRQPPALDGWGLFTVQKSNMLALFSFVLTYIVILIQMQVE
ncbi:hypothetical protein FJT64_000172 [Amphibalanus amphitrite]|uniref:Odorant receptor n=1 Tax=Amphibalanus amphitrite TaxID=1232801 RepID=A0A6A4VE83_AMPAM|nr:hypothetical protein FJT64_000172 [Amphibalanus amphitrite]